MTFDLERFASAQEGIYPAILEEIRAGHKTSHWIWFIFPQIAGLGSSWISQHFSIVSLDEARAYVADPLLGARLRECAAAILTTDARSADEIFGSLDAMKVRSSMTLFLRAAPDEPLFKDVLERFYGGVSDRLTEARLGFG